MLQLYFDGLCQPENPGGIACYGWIIKRDGQIVARGFGETTRGKDATNNVAEYSGLFYALQSLVDLGWATEPIHAFGDSNLIIKQVSGEWACRVPALLKWKQAVFELLSSLGGVTFHWISREQNTEANELSRYAYERSKQQGSSFHERFKIKDASHNH